MNRANPRLLIIEDNPETQLLMRYVLSRAYDVDVVGDPDSAYAQARRRTYDAVLVDINLGEDAVDGIDVMKHLRAWPTYEAVPFVAVTAYSMPGDEMRFLAAGFAAYVSKPFTRAHIERALADVLDQWKKTGV